MLKILLSGLQILEHILINVIFFEPMVQGGIINIFHSVTYSLNDFNGCESYGTRCTSYDIRFQCLLLQVIVIHMILYSHTVDIYADSCIFYRRSRAESRPNLAIQFLKMILSDRLTLIRILSFYILQSLFMSLSFRYSSFG